MEQPPDPALGAGLVVCCFVLGSLRLATIAVPIGTLTTPTGEACSALLARWKFILMLALLHLLATGRSLCQLEWSAKISCQKMRLGPGTDYLRLTRLADSPAMLLAEPGVNRKMQVTTARAGMQ